MVLRSLIALTTAVAAFTPLHLARSTSLNAARAGPGQYRPEEGRARPGAALERFTLVYTCNRCETRNAISVS